jgi:hypothetical protein
MGILVRLPTFIANLLSIFDVKRIGKQLNICE